MKRRVENRVPQSLGTRGGMLLESIFAISGIVLSVLFLYSSFVQAKQQWTQSRNRARADFAAMELLEFFRSMDGIGMNTYRTQFQNAPLCTDINVLDRSTGIVRNPDSVADLPEGPSKMNRFYRINVIDVRTFTINPLACNSLAPYDFAANQNERYLVTVGVNWKVGIKGTTDTFSLSGILY